MSVGHTIREARYRSGYSLRELARLIEIAPAYLSDIERNLRTPTERVLWAIAKRIDVDFDLLMRQAGRIPETVRQYVLREELAGRILRIMADAQLGSGDLQKILQVVEDAAMRQAERRKQSKGN